MTHDYKRNGTTTLFAALDVLTGTVASAGRCCTAPCSRCSCFRCWVCGCGACGAAASAAPPHGDGDMPRLEPTYNFGVDSYEIGTGYGHIAITTDDLDATLAQLKEQGIEPERPPYTVRGGSRLAFVRDPNGYRIELIEETG